MFNKNKDILKLYYFFLVCICQVLFEIVLKDSLYERRYDVFMEYMCSILDDLSVKMISYLRNLLFFVFFLNVFFSLVVKLIVFIVIFFFFGILLVILIVENF